MIELSNLFMIYFTVKMAFLLFLVIKVEVKFREIRKRYGGS